MGTLATPTPNMARSRSWPSSRSPRTTMPHPNPPNSNNPTDVGRPLDPSSSHSGASSPTEDRVASPLAPIQGANGLVEHSVAEILSNIQPGDERSMEALMPLVYAELKMLASRQLAQEARGGKGHTLQPTALVHEAFLKLVGRDKSWEGREHFMAVASKAMRQVLVDHARRRNADKRGGGAAKADVSVEAMEIEGKPAAGATSRELRVVELDELLTELAGADERTARVAEMRLFGGMELEQIATAMGLSRMTIVREWQLARAWLAAKVQDARRAEGE